MSTPHEIPQRLKNDLADQPVVDNAARVKHFANLGDVIAIMPALKRYYELTQRKTVLVQQINQLAAYYPGAVHPTVDEKGNNVCMNKRGFDMIKPLIESQPYIQAMEVYDGQQIHLDFDVIRSKTFVNLPHGMIQSWVMFAFPDLAADLSKPCITIEGDCPPHILEQVKGKIIVNFTERYRNQLADYYFLKNYAHDLIFAGTENEHYLFRSKWGLTIPFLQTNDFLEYAYAIKHARFFVGCQSFGWNLAEAMKTPRILEICQYAQNCMPFVGEDSYGFFHQVGLEYYFRTLYSKTLPK